MYAFFLRYVLSGMLLSMPFYMTAQQYINTSPPSGYYTPDYVFANMNLSEVPSGLLLDHGTPFTKLSAFNGHPDSTTLSSPLRCQLVHATLVSTIVNSNAQINLAGMGASSYSSDTVPYKIILYDYHQLKGDAVAQGLISIINNQLYDISGSANSPYERQQVLAAATWRNGPLKEGQSYTIIPELWSNLGPFDVLSYEINTGQGFVPFTLGIPLTFTPGAGANIDIELKVNLRNGEMLFSRNRMEVIPNISAIVPNGYCEEQEFTIDLSEGEPTFNDEDDRLFIRTACCDNTIRRPLLIVNGFETPMIPDDFEFNIDNDFEQILDRLETPISAESNVIQELLNDGYDLIFLDFDNENAPLEQNAEIVKTAIREINAVKQGNEELVIIGLSMGGVVSKLALLEMEATGEDHNTRLFVSMDSPLRGANIPLGLQHMIGHLNGLKVQVPGVIDVSLNTFAPSLNQMASTFASPSVKQLLLYHKDTSILNNGPNRRFYDKLVNLGKLQNCKHLAVSAGSQIGISQGFEPGDKLFSVQGTIGSVLSQFTDVSNGWGALIDIIGNLNLGTGGYTDLDFFAIPNLPNSPRRIYRGLVVARVLGIPVLFAFKDVKVTGTRPLDGAPGGFTALEVDNGFDQTRFCFIPAVSALEVGPFQSLTGPLSDPFQNISDNETVLALAITTMDEMVGVDELTPNDNVDHTIQFNLDNLSVLLANLSFGATSLGLLDHQTFNHGDSGQEYDYVNPPATFPEYRTEPIIDADLEIRESGQLWVNRADRIAFTNNIHNFQNAINTTFNVYIQPSFCDSIPTTVRVHKGGRMELGEWNNGAGVNNIGNVFVLADATVEVAEEGEIFVNNESEFVVEPGGQVIVEADGIFNAGFGGKIRIKNGGEVVVHTDGILRIFNDSHFIVEEGGKLTIHPGAKIQLWDPNQIPGRPSIKVYGTLDIMGEFDFSGSHGFFDFYSGHHLELSGGIFKLRGQGKGKRFIRLNQSALLKIGSGTLHLIDGRIEYGNGSQVRVGNEGEAMVANVEMAGHPNAIGLELDGVRVLRVTNSDFYDFVYGISGYGIYPVNPPLDFFITNSQFHNNSFAIAMNGGGTMRILNTEITAGTSGGYALWLTNIEGTRLASSTISGFTAPYPAAMDSWGAVLLEDIGEFVLTGGSEITNNDVGIYCPVGKKANVFMYGQSVISNHTAYGIHLAEGGIDVNEVDYGLVLMDCAQLLNNAIGIAGQDILLQIDAIENSGTADPAYIRANHFQNGGAGSILFDICYDDRDDIMEVNARGNYWGTDNANPSNVAYSLHQKTYGCSGLSEVDLITDNQAIGEPVGCPSPPSEPEYPTEVFCSIFIDGHIKVDEYYYAAYKAYLEAIQNDLSTFQARQAFSIPAGIPDSHRNSASQVCKHYIDIARVMLDIENSYAYGASHALSDEYRDIENSKPGSGLTHQTKVMVFPNPAEDIVYLSGINKESGVNIYDDNGRIVKQINDADLSLEIDVSALAKGLYMLKIMDTQTGEFELHKIIVQ